MELALIRGISTSAFAALECGFITSVLIPLGKSTFAFVVAGEIESVLNPGDEDGDSDDGFEYDVDDIDESMINERAGRRGRNRRGKHP